MFFAFFPVILIFLTTPVCGQTSPAIQTQPPGISASEAMEGWISLFDGKTLYGWKKESDANWSVTDGEIHVSRGKAGLLRTTSQFDDFVLKLEFKADAKTNSGVFVRTSPRPQGPTSDCYEINIAPQTNPFPTGSIVGRKRSVVNAQKNGWSQMQIRCEGSKITVMVDGQQTASITDTAPLGKGFIGLQLNEGQIAFRNIALKPLKLKRIFNGSDLSGWNLYPNMKSKFLVDDGDMVVKDGPGQIETKKSYGNFIFQLKVKTGAPSLNSGIFFRCIPGEKMNGYESQIQNGVRNDDPTQPEDCGTGGIFRRKNARFVAAKDEEWFIKTIVAEGPHFATWVNGIQVCDWTDKRKPDQNPRRGRRLKKGTIMIQGHDPTTDIRFKDLQIRELSERRPR